MNVWQEIPANCIETIRVLSCSSQKAIESVPGSSKNATTLMKDSLKQFTQLRESLLKRQAAVQAELTQISAALGAFGSVATEPTAPAARGGGKATAKRRGGKRAENSMSLAEAVLTVTKAKPLSKPEILTAIGKLGYKFTAKSPLNSLNTLLYTNKQIKNYDGKFGPK
ncbi:MAG: hypothetical protein U1G08_08685 [Verrucomicrobiota bacterium]